MPTNNNNVITKTIYIRQPLAFIQCNDFVFIMGQLLALLDMRSYVLFHLYLSHSVISRKLHYIRSMGLINKNATLIVFNPSYENTQAMAISPPKKARPGVFKGMTE